jgi:hypothetical protein
VRCRWLSLGLEACNRRIGVHTVDLDVTIGNVGTEFETSIMLNRLSTYSSNVNKVIDTKWLQSCPTHSRAY